MASRAGAQAEQSLGGAAIEPPPPIDDSLGGTRSWRTIAIAAALGVLALAWVAALAFALAAAAPASGLAPLKVAAWIGLGCGPLALLAVLWLLALRTGPAEAGRYARAARGLRTESVRLAEMLALLNRRVATAREELAGHAADLAGIGDGASERLGKAGAALGAEARSLAQVARTLDDATATARTDLGVLLGDLPEAEARAAALAERLRTAHAAAGLDTEALTAALAKLEQQARAADQGSAVAARRLAAELERIEGGAAAADRRIGEATTRLEGAAGAALEGAAGTLDDVRHVVEDQASALAALLTQGHETLRDTGEEAARLLGARLEGLASRFDALGGRLRAHESNSRGLLGQLDQALGAIETRFAALGEHGAERTAGLTEALAAIADHADEIERTLGQGQHSADALIGRAQMLQERIEASGGQLGEAIPAALARLRLHADEGLQAIARAVPQADKLAADAEAAAARIEVAGEVLDRHGQSTVALTGQAQALLVLLARIDQTFAHVAEGASTQLVDALLRVRETAGQAAAQAREALAGAVDAAARDLGEASAREMAAALAGVGRREIAAVGQASADAADAARGASERLTRQLLAMAETTQTLEARLAEHRAAVEAENEGGFARQIGLLIEALNSTAIDVGKLLSSEPGDPAWAAYLKGDRGIFTRRAVRLLDGREAREIAGLYGDDAGFREQVNRYVHDFEAMLRRILSMRDGGTMGVTLLSSDAGKLYVALAQAIERLRR